MPAAEAVSDRFDIHLAGGADDGTEGRELPMRILVLGACSGSCRPSGRLGSRQPLAVSAETIGAVLAGVRPRLNLRVQDALAGHGELAFELVFTSFADFAPDAVVRAVPGGQALLEVRAGLAALLAALGAGTPPRLRRNCAGWSASAARARRPGTRARRLRARLWLR